MTEPTLRLGVDTGGTYTDAVLLDSDGGVVSAAKALTSHHELTIGIREAMTKLPAETLSQISLVSLSTTLATNAVVEGRGTPVCLLLAGYNARQVDKAKLEHIVAGVIVHWCRAGMMLAGVNVNHLILNRHAGQSPNSVTRSPPSGFQGYSECAIRNTTETPGTGQIADRQARYLWSRTRFPAGRATSCLNGRIQRFVDSVY